MRIEMDLKHTEWKFPKQYKNLVVQSSEETDCPISFPIPGNDVLGEYVVVAPLEKKDYGPFWRRYRELKDVND